MHRHPIDPRPGQRLREMREQLALSQGRIARMIGVSTGTIQNIEHARVHLTVDRLEQLALALRCKFSDLLR